MPKGPKGQKRPADVISNAVKVTRIATGEDEDEAPSLRRTRSAFFTMKTTRIAAVVAAVMLTVTTSPASACAGGGWKTLHLEWLCCWIWGNNHKGCKQPEPGKSPQTQTVPNGKRIAAELANSVVNQRLACGQTVGSDMLRRYDLGPVLVQSR